ncbi:MAG: TPM domain-containing protein [Candidatus Kryptoniota bacterium]
MLTIFPLTRFSKPANAGTLYKMLFLAGFLSFAFGAHTAFSFQQYNPENVPSLTQYVTDQAGVLSPEEQGTLDARLKAYQDSTSNQIVVLVVDSVPGADVFSYSMSVAEKNKVGKKGKDNGIVFLVDIGDHKTWFQVGYGLEGVVTDAYASYISDQIVVPEFKSGDYYDGIDKGITALTALIAGTFHADVSDRGNSNPLRGVNPLFFLFLIAPVFRMLFWSRRYSASSRGARRSGWFFPPMGGFGGGGFGGFGGGGGGGFSGGGGSFGGGGAGGSW